MRVRESRHHSFPKLLRGDRHLAEIVAKVIHESIERLWRVRHTASGIREDRRIAGDRRDRGLVLVW